jgi:hypothetical protein
MTYARARALVAAMIVSSLCGLPVARAQGTADAPTAAPASEEEQRRSEAKERFLRGLELAAQDDWDGALVEFLSSRELFPTRVALSNIPISLRHLKRYAEAIDAYAELEQKFGSALTPDDRKRMEDAVAELRTFVGELAVTSDQPGSTVVIDGQQRGTTPLPAPLVVNAGTHSVRVSREGFESFEAQVPVAGKQKKAVTARLRLLSKSGMLLVREAKGQVLDVLIDGALVGKTPWQGSLAVGVHGVALRGEGDVGSPPGAATVKDGETATVTLAATKLDARVRIEPLPASARVDLDGVSVGAGIWEGQLTSGEHRIEVSAPGHLPYRKTLGISSGRREILRVALERDLSNPLWSAGFRPHLFVEVMGGAALAGGFGLSAEKACDERVALPTGSVDGCSEQSSPKGFIVGGRGGYQLTSGLALEVFLGFVHLSESLKRAVVTQGERQAGTELSFSSDAASDDTSLSAPLAALSVSYQFFDKTPLLFRVWGGAMNARVKHDLSGTFRGDVPYVDDPDMTFALEQPVTVREPAVNLWVPVFGPEVRFGYRVSARFALDLGVAGLMFLGPSKLRTGGNVGTTSRRPTSLQPEEAGAVQPGVMRFEEEESVSTFFALVPTLGARVDF